MLIGYLKDNNASFREQGFSLQVISVRPVDTNCQGLWLALTFIFKRFNKILDHYYEKEAEMVFIHSLAPIFFLQISSNPVMESGHPKMTV